MYFRLTVNEAVTTLQLRIVEQKSCELYTQPSQFPGQYSIMPGLIQKGSNNSFDLFLFHVNVSFTCGVTGKNQTLLLNQHFLPTGMSLIAQIYMSENYILSIIYRKCYLYCLYCVHNSLLAYSLLYIFIGQVWSSILLCILLYLHSSVCFMAICLSV